MMWMVAAALVALGYVLSRWGSRTVPGSVVRRSSRISFALLLTYTAVTSISFQVRDDRSALFTEGLSSQNQLQVGSVLVLAGWAFYLITSRRVAINEGFTGLRIWITLLLCWYALAVIWAITPNLSGFRVIELGTLWILSIHAFSDPSASRRLPLLMIFMIAAGAISASVRSGLFDIFSPGAIRSNSLAPVAAMVALLALDTMLYRGITARYVITLAGSVWLFLAFDSLASAGALLVAVGVFMTFKVPQGKARVGALAVVGVGVLVVVFEPRVAPGAVLSQLGDAYGREERLVDNWTGRIPLWQFILDDVRHHPFGFGLGADRSIALRDATRSIGWEPLHAHNGYMSALYAGGVPAFVLVITLVGSVYRIAARLPPRVHPLAFSVISILVINNLTIVGFGGITSASWLIMMAIAASYARALDATDTLSSGHTTSRARSETVRDALK
jgi:O-antigen ligase